MLLAEEKCVMEHLRFSDIQVRGHYPNYKKTNTKIDLKIEVKPMI